MLAFCTCSLALFLAGRILEETNISSFALFLLFLIVSPFIMNSQHILYLLTLSLILSLSGCLSSKETNIFQEGNFKKGEPTLVINKIPVYRLQVHDVVSIRIRSLDVDNVEYLTLETQGIFNVNAAAAFMTGYSINDSGNIYMPAIGNVSLVGLTLDEARSKIQDRIRQTHIGDATVFVTLVSFKVSVSGEVNNPNQFYVFNNQLNIMEAISMAGGFTDFADRANVKHIRQTSRGNEVTILDMRSTALLSSPYFYLLPNDLIVVDMLKQKNQRSNLSTLIIVNTAVSAISATIAILTLIERRNIDPDGVD